jgi:hypothetical protein
VKDEIAGFAQVPTFGAHRFGVSVHPVASAAQLLLGDRQHLLGRDGVGGGGALVGGEPVEPGRSAWWT